MAILQRQFEQLANVVSAQIAELLCAQVIVINDRGKTIACSHFLSKNKSESINLNSDGSSDFRSSLRIPICFKGLIGEVIISETEVGETVSPRLAQLLVEMVVDRMASVTQFPDRHELKNKFIHDLLKGAIADEADMMRQGQILGMDFTRPRSVILIDAADYILTPATTHRGISEALIWQRSQFIINSIVSFFHLPSDTICGYIGDGEVAVLKASASQDLVLWTTGADESNLLNPSWANLSALKRSATALLCRLHGDTKATINIGIGRHHPSIQGLAKSYQDARAALSLGRRFQGPNQVYCLDELGIAAFIGIADEKTKVDLAKHWISPLDRQVDLLETLDAFFLENCCPSATAKRLSIHRNTLSYRLDKIASLTGLDPRQFDDAMQIRLALLLSDLRSPSPSLENHPISKTA